MKIFTVVAAVFIASCAHSSPSAEAARDRDAMTTPHPEIVGRALAKEGRFIEAGFYLEAALAAGSNEREVLPLLIAAQVHADRLRAAKENALRLREIVGSNRALDALIQLLERYTPELHQTNQKEVLP
jgi:hypothetical protein